MRRSRALDRFLLAVFLGAYLVVLGGTVRECLGRGPWWFPFSVTGAQGPAGYPLMHRTDTPDLPTRIGDRVLRIDDLDLRGLSRSRILEAAAPLLRGGNVLRLEAERNGERFSALVSPARDTFWWLILAGYGSFGLAAAFLLLRARQWHLARRFFVGAMLSSIGLTADIGNSDPKLAWVYAGSTPVGMAIVLRCILEWTSPVRSPPLWQRHLPWLIAAVMGGSFIAWHELTLPAGLWPPRVLAASQTVYLGVLLAGVTSTYRRAGLLERRQLKWILYGFYIGLLPFALLGLGVALGASLRFIVWQAVGAAFLVAIPIGFVVSIVGYRYLDIDRLISATASYSLLGVVALGSAVAFLPRLAKALSQAVGIEPESSEIALALALAAVVVTGHRVLRPWLDREIFAEWHALAESFSGLQSELSTCGTVAEITRLTGERIDALLRPEAVATYARAGDAFEPLFVRGRAAPPAFEAGSVLVQVLERNAVPLVARSRKIGAFDRAALETLGVEVVVPIRRGEGLVAFICLSSKRSGDIYTRSDLALLAALASRCSEVLARLDADTIAREAQAIQSALRRYVPGAVADRLVRGEALAPAEQEVTVLFVDIRSYSRFAEGRNPEDVFATLNEHTERVSRIVQECGGTIVEFNGDGLMAVFGAPEALAKKEQSAVEAARRIVDSMPAPLAVGVGVATGSAFVGSIRSTDRLIWSAVGSTTNLAARLQSMTRGLGASIALDQTTHERAGYVCTDFTRYENLAIRGRTGRFEVFALPLR